MHDLNPICAECGWYNSTPSSPRRIWVCARGKHCTPNDRCPQDGATQPDMVNSPPHYTRGPVIDGSLGDCCNRVIECIEVIRHIRDMRLATAMKYIWRVAFGGKANDREDIEKAIWYLNDWLEKPC